MSKIRTVLCGCGGRGSWLARVAEKTEEFEIIGVCDVYLDKAESVAKLLKEQFNRDSKAYADVSTMYDELNPEAVIIACSWEDHAKMACEAMNRGIKVGLEVGGAYSEEECWELVDTYERTKTPFMFLENCCYNVDEILATSLHRNGRLGKIVYCSGAYGHDLRDEIAGGYVNRHYRLRNYIGRNCDNYPTHELGPIAKIIDINRGNRFTSLISKSTGAYGLKQYVLEREEHKDLWDVEFKQADIVHTFITCENGELIDIKLDTTLPRIANRDLVVAGTKGRYEGNINSVQIEGEFSHLTIDYKKQVDTAYNYKEYLPEVWKNPSEQMLKAGHGGMDYLQMVEWAKAMRNGDEMPIDVYDAVSWMCITYLSEKSLKEGGVNVEIPDFTRGKYKTRPRKDVLEMPNIGYVEKEKVNVVDGSLTGNYQ